MSRCRRTAAVIIAAFALTAACSGDGDTATTTTTSPDENAENAETTVVDPPRCEDLTDPVDAARLEGVGCLEQDDVVAIATTVDCPDGQGTIVFISDQMGLEGGEWVDADENWESLCP